MKKLLIGLLALCLVFGFAVGMNATKARVAGSAISPDPVASAEEGTPVPETPAEPAPEETAAETPAEAAAPAESVPEEEGTASGRIDYEALYQLHAPEEKVLKVNDREESWGDYFYILFTQCGQIEDYFNSMSAYYGMQFGWSDPIEEDGGESFADTALESSEKLMVQLGALEAFAAENGVEVGEEMRSLIEAQKKQDIVSALGEEGSEEAFLEHLASIHLSPEMYDRIITQNFLYQECFNKLYGENAEKLSDEAAMSFLENGGYLSAAHILLVNTDAESGEKLDENALKDKKEELEKIVGELRAVEDPQARKEAFLKKAAELSEDPGSAYYPEGYTFTKGTMVPEFETAAEALEDYAISDVVETSYGYHILMRLPLSPDAIVEFNSSSGAARTARMLAANQEYGEKLQATADALKLEWLPGYARPELLNYVAE